MQCPEFRKFGSDCQCKVADVDETFFGMYYSSYVKNDYVNMPIPDECPFKVEQDMQEWNDEKKP